MTLQLYYHPFSSYCQKVLIALYEKDLPFERAIVDLGDPEQRAALQKLWPFAKFPVLRDLERGLTLPESSIITEHLDRIAPDAAPLIPADPDEALKVRLWDRFFDNYVSAPLQKAVGDSLRPEGQRDPYGVEEARTMLATAYSALEAELAAHDGDWVAGGDFSLADCSAAPALFYANIVHPFAGKRMVEAYYRRLLARPSFARAVEEARPYRHLFPLEWPDSY
ncbi:glutathione S-transferase family protein [Allosphingosinicella sp.]|uniref:glutathione S-transferase family protein n=1 Tax=Allosphingosinicella sp. TaxID=2823234 RepID=UPI002F0DD1C2